MSSNTRQVPGTGLSIFVFTLITALSVVVFLVWGELLWRAPREASHVMRFVVSYLVVIPLVALALVATRRWSGGHAFAATGLIWCIKLLVTSGLYQVVARGTAVEYNPAVASAPAARAGTAPSDDYVPAPGPFARGTVTGRVLAQGHPVADAVVYLDRAAPGLPAPAPATVELVIEGARHLAPLQVAHAQGTLRVRNRDAGLHTAHVLRDGRALGNQPVPSGGAVVITTRGRGLYQIRCDTHPGEQAWLVVVDHPYATRTDKDGRFTLDAVPAGAASVSVVAIESNNLWRETRPISVSEDKTTDIALEVAPAHAAKAPPTPPTAL